MAAVFGGDGAFIAAARRLAPLGLPLFGINLGTLGFLTDLSPRNMRAGGAANHSGKVPRGKPDDAGGFGAARTAGYRQG